MLQTICRKLNLFHFETSQFEDLSPFRFLDLWNNPNSMLSRSLVSPRKHQAKFHQNLRLLNKFLKTPILWKTKSIWFLVSTINAYFQAGFAGTPHAEFWSDPLLVYSKSCFDKRCKWLLRNILKTSKRKMCTETQLEIRFSAIFFLGLFLCVGYGYFWIGLYTGMI